MYLGPDVLDKLKPGTEIVMEGFIAVSEYGHMTFVNHEIPGYMVICPHTVKFTVPEDFNLIAKSVEALDKQADVLADEYHKQRAIIADKREQLLQLAYSKDGTIDMENQ